MRLKWRHWLSRLEGFVYLRLGYSGLETKAHADFLFGFAPGAGILNILIDKLFGHGNYKMLIA
jgi:hypothetical protein